MNTSRKLSVFIVGAVLAGIVVWPPRTGWLRFDSSIFGWRGGSDIDYAALAMQAGVVILIGVTAFVVSATQESN